MDYPAGSADEEMEQLMDLIHREIYGDESSFEQELADLMRSNQETKSLPVSLMDYPAGSADEEMEQLMDLIHREIYGDESSFEQELADLMRSNQETKHLDCSCLGLGNLTVAKSSSLLQLAWQLDTKEIAMPPSERIKNLSVTQQIRLYEQRCKTFGRVILEPSEAKDFELAKLLLCKKKKLEEAIGLLRQGECVKYVPRPPVLNATFKKLLLTEAELADSSLTKIELDSVKSERNIFFRTDFSRNIFNIVIDNTIPVFNAAIVCHTGRHNNWDNLTDKRNILARTLQMQQTDLEDLLKYLQCFSHEEIRKELFELSLSNKRSLEEITEERCDLNELEPHFWNAYIPELNKNLSLGPDQLQVAVTWVKPDLSLSCTKAPNRFILIKLNYPVDEPQEKSLPDFTNVKHLRADYTVLFYLFRNVSPITISQMKLFITVLYEQLPHAFQQNGLRGLSQLRVEQKVPDEPISFLIGKVQHSHLGNRCFTVMAYVTSMRLRNEILKRITGIVVGLVLESRQKQGRQIVFDLRKLSRNWEYSKCSRLLSTIGTPFPHYYREICQSYCGERRELQLSYKSTTISFEYRSLKPCDSNYFVGCRHGVVICPGQIIAPLHWKKCTLIETFSNAVKDEKDTAPNFSSNACETTFEDIAQQVQSQIYTKNFKRRLIKRNRRAIKAYEGDFWTECTCEEMQHFHIKQRSTKIPTTLHETEISLMDLDRLATLRFEIDTKEYGFLEVLVRRRKPINGANFIQTKRTWLTLVRRTYQNSETTQPEVLSGAQTPQSQSFSDNSGTYQIFAPRKAHSSSPQNPAVENLQHNAMHVLKANSASPVEELPQLVTQPHVDLSLNQADTSTTLHKSQPQNSKPPAVNHWIECAPYASNCTRLYSYQLLEKQADRLFRALGDSGTPEEVRQRNLQELNYLTAQIKAHEARVLAPTGTSERENYLKQLFKFKTTLEVASKTARNNLPHRVALDYQLNVVIKELESLGVKIT
ncbi:hypothetical protein T265_06183 [Opisthorchis viverrini]|uniref:Uncharacterized protein n=1 Tax=Opisthorchis viverrini TaxID=6198 RepID=A0A074ZTA7_OPIVI|nr:hypothetical protein T265_06183 [Opisthorchis viverrini]KER26610.1 hypothetical protein T265_06183 [Opisthorchis viverrini]